MENWNELFNTLGIESVTDLLKAKSRDGLTPVQKQVTRGGKTFTTTVWVKQGEGTGGSEKNHSEKKPEEKNAGDGLPKLSGELEKLIMESGNALGLGMAIDNHPEKENLKAEWKRVQVDAGISSYSYNKVNALIKKYVSEKRSDSQNKRVNRGVAENSESSVEKEAPKKVSTVKVQEVLRPIRKELGTEKYKEFLQASGVTWERNTENEGADTMRASMAAKKFIESGGTLDKDVLDSIRNGGKNDANKK